MKEPMKIHPEEKASQRTPKRGQPSEEKGAIKQSEVV